MNWDFAWSHICDCRAYHWHHDIGSELSVQAALIAHLESACNRIAIAKMARKEVA